MPKYLVKLTKYKDRCSITIPKELVEKRGLGKFDYILIQANNNREIKIRGFDVKDKKRGRKKSKHDDH